MQADEPTPPEQAVGLRAMAGARWLKVGKLNHTGGSSYSGFAVYW